MTVFEVLAIILFSFFLIACIIFILSRKKSHEKYIKEKERQRRALNKFRDNL